MMCRELLLTLWYVRQVQAATATGQELPAAPRAKAPVNADGLIQEQTAASVLLVMLRMLPQANAYQLSSALRLVELKTVMVTVLANKEEALPSVHVKPASVTTASSSALDAVILYSSIQTAISALGYSTSRM